MSHILNDFSENVGLVFFSSTVCCFNESFSEVIYFCLFVFSKEGWDLSLWFWVFKWRSRQKPCVAHSADRPNCTPFFFRTLCSKDKQWLRYLFSCSLRAHFLGPRYPNTQNIHRMVLVLSHQESGNHSQKQSRVLFPFLIDLTSLVCGNYKKKSRDSAVKTQGWSGSTTFSRKMSQNSNRYIFLRRNLSSSFQLNLALIAKHEDLMKEVQRLGTNDSSYSTHSSQTNYNTATRTNPQLRKH